MEEEDSFLAPPVFEHTFGWEASEKKLKDLEGSLLSKSVLDALDHSNNKQYAFKKGWYPHAHQLNAWETLLSDKPQSAIVTSGTGSGKTECFMVPILQDLYQEYEASGDSLVGVRALFLYPLNALINSQKERFMLGHSISAMVFAFVYTMVILQSMRANIAKNKMKNRMKY
ncbi:putative helicase [Vibrio ishigakensis]|uniref:Putative helicase n=1 Tax=Vibrio ishigakensis TaxID=1481914 RepID=A0A0B8QG64_9VIBR|nr:putative helicase [Vibrio ishigakensis]